MSVHFDPDAKNHNGEALTYFTKCLSAISQSWEERQKQMPFSGSLTFSPEGLTLGAGTIIAKSVTGAERRILALLRIAFNGAIPDRVIDTLNAAEHEFKRGELAKAAMLVALSKIPAQIDVAGARRLHISKAMLDAGLMSLAGAEKLVSYPEVSGDGSAKFSVDQPRVPKGNEGGGQWTKDQSTSEPSKIVRVAANPVAMSTECQAQWVEGYRICEELLSQANPPRRLTGGYTDPHSCAIGFVSEGCGGNKVRV